MKDRKDEQFRLALILGIIFSIIIVLSFYFFSSAPRHTEVNGVNSDLLLMLSDQRKSVFELSTEDGFQKMKKGEGRISKRKYAYLIVKLQNRNLTDRNLVIYNLNWNYYVEMLKPEEGGAVTLYRYGDRVPLAESPFRHVKAGFPVELKARSECSFILEYYGPKGLVIHPEIIDYPQYLDIVATERLFIGIICGFFFFLLFLNTVNGIMLNGLYFFPVVAFIGSVFFFFLRQSRLLLLFLSPLIYPEWLFPLTIGLNTLSIIFFIYFLMRRYFGRLIKLILAITFISVLMFTTISFFTLPYVMADTLNSLSLILIVPVTRGLYSSIKKKEYFTLYIVLSFIPWLFAVFFDIAAALSGKRLLVPAEYQQAPGMIASLVLLSLTLQYMHYRRYKKDLDNVAGELEKSRMESEQKLVEVTELKTAVIHQLGYQFRQPLDSIMALLVLMDNKYDDPEIKSALKLIVSETETLKRMLESEIIILDNEIGQASENLISPTANVNRFLTEAKPWTDISICIFDFDPVHSARTAMILRSSGYEVRIVSEQYQILSLINTGKTDVLIIDPVSTGESAFSLCGLIRGEYNIFEVPILMITNYHADYLMKKGYGAGVNDFLTRPFDSSELSARIQSLIRLKKVVKHNHDLAKSEKEKNTFLYFLTHNINTPLTLLLNRIQELSVRKGRDVGNDLVEDLFAAGREINEIVQNVLISFRLSDGRQTVRFSRLEVDKIALRIEADLSGKAAEKKQHFSFDIQPDLPAVSGDYSAVRGIIYNLVDNAIKFTPAEGAIKVHIFSDEDVQIEVSDNGPGIPQEDRSLLFERFQRLSALPTAGESSTGLGLYVAHELAGLNGGSLIYKDTGAGACFVFSLPAFCGESDE